LPKVNLIAPSKSGRGVYSFDGFCPWIIARMFAKTIFEVLWQNQVVRLGMYHFSAKSSEICIGMRE
jgi:hypothetical protein